MIGNRKKDRAFTLAKREGMCYNGKREDIVTKRNEKHKKAIHRDRLLCAARGRGENA